MPPFARVNLIIAKYGFLGVSPKVIPSVLLNIPNPIEHIPRQDGKDLAYVKQLAEEVGYVFYHEPSAKPGTSVMYWGPEIKVGTPQARTQYRYGCLYQCGIHQFLASILKRQPLHQAWIHNPETKVPIAVPIPSANPLSPPLGVIPPIPKNFESINKTAKYKPAQAIMMGLAKASKAADGVTANGSLDVLRYWSLTESA